MILIQPRNRLRPTGFPVGRIAFPERVSSSCRRQYTSRCPTRPDSGSRSSPVRTGQDPKGCTARPHTPNTSARTCPCFGSSPRSMRHIHRPTRSLTGMGNPSDGTARRSHPWSDKHSPRSATQPAAGSRSTRSCTRSRLSTAHPDPCRSLPRPAYWRCAPPARPTPPQPHPCRKRGDSSPTRGCASDDRMMIRPPCSSSASTLNHTGWVRRHRVRPRSVPRRPQECPDALVRD